MLDLIKKRRSIRKYTDEPVSDADIKAVLEAAMAAPSADNLQPWEFVVVQGRTFAGNWPRPTPGAGCAPMHRWFSSSAAMSGVPATGWRIQAQRRRTCSWRRRGWGRCGWECTPHSRYEAHVRDVLGILRELRVLCLVPVGHPAESKPPRTQYDERKVHYDGYRVDH